MLTFVFNNKRSWNLQSTIINSLRGQLGRHPNRSGIKTKKNNNAMIYIWRIFSPDDAEPVLGIFGEDQNNADTVGIEPVTSRSLEPYPLHHGDLLSSVVIASVLAKLERERERERQRERERERERERRERETERERERERRERGGREEGREGGEGGREGGEGGRDRQKEMLLEEPFQLT
ncbi:hypothetical protein DPMN_187663 [Dreissena polymorpha]|uniref:Uncharacterized protein n=1 Tax=Dreissena polymorpha TaxID=45954 RepID=A0A9D4DQ81_DREPO|nr:hypothetical protein DPMN_187663 [Dreissena polymorpha]